MATLIDLRNLWSNDLLKNRIEQASQIVCWNIIGELGTVPNHTERLAWAVKVLADPSGWADTLLRVIVAKYNASTIATITSATDALVIAAVEEVVNAFALNV